MDKPAVVSLQFGPKEASFWKGLTEQANERTTYELSDSTLCLP
jgi:hypothetical protein